MSTVKLRARTVPVFDDETVTDASSLIVYCARVSNPSNQESFKTGEKLLKYCRKKAHWSVFEQADLTMEINCPRDISRQILRHKSFNFQEYSQRYATVDSLGEVIYREPRLQDHKNRQKSIETDDEQLNQQWYDIQNTVWSESIAAYNWAISKGIAKEQARAVLPEGLTPTRMYMKGSLRNWLHYCVIRTGPETQKEHREIAEKCWKIVVSEFPFLKDFDIHKYREVIQNAEE